MSAYPDLQPWQVRKACFGVESSDTAAGKMGTEGWLEAYYYGYLSMLLHPQQGNEAARCDCALIKVRMCNARLCEFIPGVSHILRDVQEWCEWSIGIDPLDTENRKPVDKDWRKNFFRVAARSTSDHLCYKRDLKVLLELSMAINEHNLALDLCKLAAQWVCRSR